MIELDKRMLMLMKMFVLVAIHHPPELSFELGDECSGWSPGLGHGHRLSPYASRRHLTASSLLIVKIETAA